MSRPDALTLAPTADPRIFVDAHGARRSPPADWGCLPPGDAGLTRRVKLAGPSWSVRFAPRFEGLARAMAEAIAAHATPVGSGTVARPTRIPIEARAEAATIAWMRHQTTAYDHMQIARIKGARREVRRELARVSHAVLDSHRRDAAHGARSCPLCAQRLAPEEP